MFIFLVKESLFDSFSINLIPNSHLQANSILVRQARLHAPLFSYLCTGLDPLIFCDSAFDFDDKKKKKNGVSTTLDDTVRSRTLLNMSPISLIV